MKVLSDIFHKAYFVTFIFGLYMEGGWPIYKQAIPYSPPLLFAGMRALIGGFLFSAVLFPVAYVIYYSLVNAGEASKVGAYTVVNYNSNKENAF